MLAVFSRGDGDGILHFSLYIFIFSTYFCIFCVILKMTQSRVAVLWEAALAQLGAPSACLVLGTQSSWAHSPPGAGAVQPLSGAHSACYLLCPRCRGAC